MMQPNKTLLLIRLFIRGSILIAAMVYFFHTQMIAPLSLRPSPRQNPNLLSRLAKKANISELQVKKVLLELGPELALELQKGNKVNLPGLGSLQMVHVPAFQQEDQKNRQTIIIPASNQVDFQPSNQLLQEINQNPNQRMADAKKAIPIPGVNPPDNSPIQQAVLREPHGGN